MPRIIRKTYRLKAPLYRVWPYFASGTGLSSWFSERGTLLEPQVGGRIVIYFAGKNEIASGTVTDYVPGKTLAFRWELGNLTGRDEFSNVRFDLSEEVQSDGSVQTVVKMVDEGIPEDPAWIEYYAGTQSGWSVYLMNLKSVAETGYDLRDVMPTC